MNVYPDESTPFYPAAPASGDAAGGGHYNSYLLSALLMAVWLPSGLAFFVLLSLLVALSLASSPLSTSLSFAPLSAQLYAFAHLTLHVLWDGRFFWLGSALFDVCFREITLVWSDMILPVPPFHVPSFQLGYSLYAFYIAVRTLYLVFALFLSSSSRSPRQLLWSWSLGNVGLVVRCFKYDAFRFVFRSFGPSAVFVSPASSSVHLLYLALFAVWLTVQIRFFWSDNIVFYKLHRSLHRSAVLFSFCHAVHHESVSPTVLDSGTIAPPELLLSDSSMPALLLSAPSGFILGYELYALVGHWAAHASSLEPRASLGHSHRLHHRRPGSNFGIHSHYDRLFHTHLQTK